MTEHTALRQPCDRGRFDPSVTESGMARLDVPLRASLPGQDIATPRDLRGRRLCV